MATIPKAILDILTNSKTAKFAESLKHSDLPTGWADDPEIVDLAAKAWQEAGTDSPFFRAWFGGSKVVDDAGKPLPMYHGTLEKGLEQFSPDFVGSRYGADDRGYFFDSLKNIAEDYSRSEFDRSIQGDVLDTFLKMDNPLLVNEKWLKKQGMSGKLKSEDPIEFWDNRSDFLLDKFDKSKKADGILIDDGQSVMGVAFEPNQIKSTLNRGTFNPSDPNIYRTLAPLGVGTAAMAAALLGDGSEAEAATPQKILNYMMKHRPATVESSAPLHDLENVYPGIYNMRDRVDYKTFEPGMNDNAILNLMASVRNKPDAMVDVFRAVPKGVRDFNTGDWITLSKPYAREHGNSYLDGDFDIIKTRARAGDISNPGDSIMEQGYWGAPVKGTKTRGLLPFAAGTGAMAAALLGDGDEAKAAAINAALADPASREKAAAAGLPYDPPVEESAWSPADLLVAPVGAVGIPAKLLAMALDAPVTLGLDAGLSALGGLFGGVDRKKPGGW